MASSSDYIAYFTDIRDRSRDEAEEPEFTCEDCGCAIEEDEHPLCDDCWKKGDLEPDPDQTGQRCAKCGGVIDPDTALASDLCAECCAKEAQQRIDREDAIRDHVRAQLLKIPVAHFKGGDDGAR